MYRSKATLTDAPSVLAAKTPANFKTLPDDAPLARTEAAVLFARTESIIPAPESSHAIRGAIDEALLSKEEGKEKVILFNLSGHGHVDMAAYDAYFNNELQDYEYPEAAIAESLSHLPKVG